MGNFKAHHGIGIIHEKMGNTKLMKKHFSLGAKYSVEESKHKMWGIFADEINSEDQEDE